jgi:hypothetical protein
VRLGGMVALGRVLTALLCAAGAAQASARTFADALGTPILAPMLYASTRPVRAGPWLQFQGYLNGGVNFDAEDVPASEGRYGVGLDCRVAERVTAAVAFLARHPFRRIGEAGIFDLRRVTRGGGQPLTAPLFGFRGERADFYDLSVGGRVNLWRDTLLATANVLVPLNDDGFRSDVIPLVGIEATF